MERNGRDSGERDSARLAWMLKHDAPLQLLLWQPNASTVLCPPGLSPAF